MWNPPTWAVLGLRPMFLDPESQVAKVRLKELTIPNYTQTNRLSGTLSTQPIQQKGPIGRTVDQTDSSETEVCSVSEKRAVLLTRRRDCFP